MNPIQTLTLTLAYYCHDPTLACHIIKVIDAATFLHRSLIPSTIQTIRPFLIADDRIAADAIVVVEFLGKYFVLDEDLVISLSSSSAVVVRSKIGGVLVKNLALVRFEIVMRVFLADLRDFYPSVRKLAVDRVVELLRRDRDSIDGLIFKGCYDYGVEILRDEDEFVRVGVIRLVSECARLFDISKYGGGSEMANVIFVQLPKVRHQVIKFQRCNCLLIFITTDILLQTDMFGVYCYITALWPHYPHWPNSDETFWHVGIDQ